VDFLVAVAGVSGSQKRAVHWSKPIHINYNDWWWFECVIFRQIVLTAFLRRPSRTRSQTLCLVDMT
jgi:hypothetical protein